jgi:hypothetical protein
MDGIDGQVLVRLEVYVAAANNGEPIRDAQFSGNGPLTYWPWSPYGMGDPGYYVLYAAPLTYVALSAPNYQTSYFYSDIAVDFPFPSIYTVALTYIGGTTWPQTQNY